MSVFICRHFVVTELSNCCTHTCVFGCWMHVVFVETTA